jgi:Carboxypeptidase regulatory-like domain/TonB dependent receptor
MRKLLQLTLAFMLAATGSLLAQGVTTSILTGKVTDEKGAGIPGANIVAVHTPSGTQYGVVTSADGRFNIQNMRVGGPYRVTISFIGYATQAYDDVYTKLGEPFSLNHVMKEEGTQLEEIVVLGTEDKIMNSNRNGTLTNVSARQILTLPTISRSINDMTRLTPQASSTSSGSIGGGNYRQNFITVDGSDFNNTFGIGGNLPAGGSPISLDALEEISVNITPFDIRQSGFIGSSINAVTRSGTNTFTGSAYTFFRNEKMQGDKVGDNDKLTRAKLQDNTYGFRLGGPIIKDKLFFFVNAEYQKRISPGQLNVAATPEAPFGSSPNVARPTAAQLDIYSNYLRENYGYETGPYQGYDFENTNLRFVGRLDWNINNNHRFNVRYSQVESKTPIFPSTSRSPLPGLAQTRTNIVALPYKNSNYYQDGNFYSLAAELNSTFGGKFANTLRGTYTHQNDPRSSDSKVFPFVDILDGTTIPAAGQGTPLTSFGYEPFSYGNLRDVKTYSIVDNLTWTTGIHNFTVGGQIDLSTTKNGFQRFATSYYTFRSWNDFITGVRPVDFAMTYSLLPNYEQAFPTFKFAQYSVYGQDEFTLSDRLKITAGLRVDLPSYRDVKEIQTHPLIAGLTFADGEKIDTGVLPENKLMWSPRVGFNWDVKGDRSIQLRGGTGVFTGRVPTVWIVSQSGDAGLIQFTQTWITPNTPINGVVGTNQRNDPTRYVTPGPFNPDPNAYRPATQPAAGTAIGLTSAIARDFKFPQTWKSSLAVDVKLPFGMIGSLEGIVNKDLNIAIGRNPNLVAPRPLGVAGYPDNRPIYPSTNSQRFINPLTTAGLPVATGAANGTVAYNPVVLGNAHKGYYWSVTAKVEKQFSQGFSAMAAYTKSKSRVIYDGVGDQLLNTWSLTQIVDDSNNPEMASAGYVVPDRVIASLTYRKEYLKHFATSVSLFYEGSIAGRFSYTYSGDLNQDGQTNDLIYIPKDPSEITFVPLTIGSGASAVTYSAQQQSDMFFEYIEQDKYLKKHKGSYAERNGALMPWRSQIDFRIIQDIFTNIGGRNNTIQLTLDIFNFGNLLNKDWGVIKTINNSNILAPANTVAPGTRPTFRLAQDRGVPITSTFRENNSILSTYYMQAGVRYTF